MKVSKIATDLIIGFEGVSSKIKGKNVPCAKDDIKNNIIIYPYFCTAGKKTIGVGCLIENETIYDNGVPISKIIHLFLEKLKEFESMLNAWLDFEIKQNQFDALMCMCFNIPKGAKAICKMINENESAEKIKNTWVSFCNANGMKSNSLLIRRKIEFNLFSL